MPHVVHALGALALAVALASPGAAQAQSAAPGAPGASGDDALLDAWQRGDWDLAQRVANEHRAAHPDDARARVVNAAVRLRLPAASVVDLDEDALALSVVEIHRIELQRTIAEAVGAASALFGTAGLAVAVFSSTLDGETFRNGGMGFAIGGGTTGAIALVAAAIAAAVLLDVPFRWQRWTGTLVTF